MYFTLSTTMKAGLWMVGAVVSFSIMAIAGRELTGKLDSFEIMLWRSLAGMIIVSGLAWHLTCFSR